MTEVNKAITRDLIPGVYSAIGKFLDPSVDFLDSSKNYMCALSIGYNPVYDNAEKTIEVYLMDDFG